MTFEHVGVFVLHWHIFTGTSLKVISKERKNQQKCAFICNIFSNNMQKMHLNDKVM